MTPPRLRPERCPSRIPGEDCRAYCVFLAAANVESARCARLSSDQSSRGGLVGAYPKTRCGRGCAAGKGHYCGASCCATPLDRRQGQNTASRMWQKAKRPFLCSCLPNAGRQPIHAAPNRVEPGLQQARCSVFPGSREPGAARRGSAPLRIGTGVYRSSRSPMPAAYSLAVLAPR
jgi:hypothetical protein